MRINFTARHFKLSEGLKEHATEQVSRLKKYYDDILDIDLILSWVKTEQIAEINLSVFGHKLTVVEKSDDMYKSIAIACDKMERNLIKYKNKLRKFDKERIVENIEEPA